MQQALKVAPVFFVARNSVTGNTGGSGRIDCYQTLFRKESRTDGFLAWRNLFKLFF